MSTHITKKPFKGPSNGIVFRDPLGRYGNFDIYEKDKSLIMETLSTIEKSKEIHLTLLKSL